MCSNNIFCWKTGQHSFNRYNKTIEERGQRLSIGRRIDTCAYIVYVKYTHTRVLGGPKFTFLAGNQVRFFLWFGVYTNERPIIKYNGGIELTRSKHPLPNVSGTFSDFEKSQEQNILEHSVLKDLNFERRRQISKKK